MILKYFKSSIVFALFGLSASFFVGYYYAGHFSGALEALFIATILAVLEVSLSFDNAIVNAKVLQDMSDLWRQRFLTWGMIIAVFGMRLVFPILIVSGLGKITPWQALEMAFFRPQDYAQMMLSIHPMVAAFGGTFLLLVALKYFFDDEKDLHWVGWLEKRLVQLGRLEVIEIVFALMTLILISQFVGADKQLSYLLAGLSGLITFLVVDALGSYLESSSSSFINETSSETHVKKNLERASLGMFIYLEILDASFSFDGVVGAFAVSNNLLIIMIGLGVGAFFVRSLTILFVDRNTLSSFKFLEHGAFYAIFVLAGFMLFDPLLHLPEWITGLSGAVIIGISLGSSLRVRGK